MKIVDIVPKDISVLMEFSVSNIDSILFCLNHCEITINETVEVEVAHMTYFKDVFYKTLSNLQGEFADES